MLLALQLVVAATRPIAEAQGVRVIFATLSGDPMLDMLIGAIFAVLCWSSLAAVLLAATFAASHVVSTPVAFCLVLGANLGSALLALIVNARTPGGGRRVAFGNLLFKVAGCIVFLLAMSPVMDLIAAFDPDTRRQVLDFHVMYNVALAVVFLGCTEMIAAVVVSGAVQDRVPDQPRSTRPALHPPSPFNAARQPCIGGVGKC